MSAIADYEPTKEDVNFFLNTASLLRDGGVWGIPMSEMTYRVNKQTKTLVLVSPAWDATPMTMLTHHHNDYICRRVGWQIEPKIDWSELSI